MRNRVRLAVIVFSAAAWLGGCVAGMGPIVAPVTINMRGPVSAGPAASSAKVGTAEAWGFALVGTGDASIGTAMQNGGITKIHHVDQETLNILWIFAKYTTIVYGE